MEVTITLVVVAVLVIAVYLIFSFCKKAKKPPLKRVGKSISSPRPISNHGSKLKQIYKISAQDSIVIAIDLNSSSLRVQDHIYQLSDTFSSIANYYIVCPAKSDEEEASILELLAEVHHRLLPKARILFYSQDIGKIAFIRQIKPKLYIDYDASTIAALKPHVPFIVEYSRADEVLDSLLSTPS